jgi:creatinine amidohydrolase/Fe(II)-dependent formamide hydrolase-like protein
VLRVYAQGIQNNSANKRPYILYLYLSRDKKTKMEIRRIIILPLGSYEYHGPFLPADTDNIIVTEISKAMVAVLKSKKSKQYSNIILLPTLNFGTAEEHLNQPFTVSIPQLDYYKFVYNIAFSITKPDDLIIILNGHGGNYNILRVVESDFNHGFQDKKILVTTLYSDQIKVNFRKNYGDPGVHAGSLEACLIGYYLNMESTINNINKLNNNSKGLNYFNSSQISDNGIISNSEMILTDPKIGKETHDFIVFDLEKQVDTFIQYCIEISQ